MSVELSGEVGVVPHEFALFALLIAAAPVAVLMAGAFAPEPVRRAGHGLVLSAVGAGAMSKDARGHVDLAAVNDNEIEKNVAVRASTLAQWGKRAFDIAAALSLIVFLAPLLIVTAIAIRLDSKGPVLYRQRRGGHLDPRQVDPLVGLEQPAVAHRRANLAPRNAHDVE